jgi:hypothetical protein
MGWWSSLWRSRAESWLFERLADDRVPTSVRQRRVIEDADYITIELRSLRIVDVRKGLSKFYGAAHSYASVPHLGGERAEFQVVSVPTYLKNLDASNADRVIQDRKTLLGPVPYRSGPVEFELGLFSIKSSDLLEPYLALLERISTLAGVAFVNTALPFARPIVEGLQLLTGGADSTVLEVGVSTAFNPPETGFYVVARARAKDWRGRLKLDDSFELVDSAGKAVTQFPYLVFTLTADDKRSDWFELPDVSKAYGVLRSDVARGNVEVARESFAHFKRVVGTSPDLLRADAQRLVAKVDDEMAEVLGATLTAGGEQTEMRALVELNLFDQPSTPDR